MSEIASKSLVIIPTYNEIDNLNSIVNRTLVAEPKINILIIDDNSPDGTGELADKLAEKYPNQISVLHRKEKNGLGRAYIEGFKWGIGKGFEYLIEMDADGSHPPEKLPEMLTKAMDGADLVIGSRYVKGGKVVNWPKKREYLSKLGNTYTRIMLGTKIKDITAGYRVYTAALLSKIDLDKVESHGYCFQVDLTWRAIKSKAKIIEVPITFMEREHGVSKMSGSIVKEALSKVTIWGIKDRVEKITSVAKRILPFSA